MTLLDIVLLRLMFISAAIGSGFACAHFTGTGAAWVFGVIAIVSLFSAVSDITLSTERTKGSAT